MEENVEHSLSMAESDFVNEGADWFKKKSAPLFKAPFWILVFLSREALFVKEIKLSDVKVYSLKVTMILQMLHKKLINP